MDKKPELMITPVEIRQQRFKKSFRGYDPEEVQAFLQALAQEWEQQQQAYQRLKEELDKVQTSYHTLKEVEGMLHKTLVQAERCSREVLENAQQKAELKVQEAEAQAREILRQSRADRDTLQHEMETLVRQRDQVLGQLEVFLKSQLNRLQSFDLVEISRGHVPELSGRSAESRLPKVELEEDLFSEANHEPAGENADVVDDIMKDL
jgi:DivIVA domain-containing protein